MYDDEVRVALNTKTCMQCYEKPNELIAYLSVIAIISIEYYHCMRLIQ